MNYDNFISVIIYVLLIILLFYKAGISKKNMSKSEHLENINVLRGFFAIEIILGHMIRYENTWLFPLGRFMIISVAFFFFVSAMGMVISYEKKAHYLNGFLLRKVTYLLSIVVIIFVYSCLLDWIYPAELGYFRSDFFSAFLEKTNWFIWELLFFYVLFFISYRFFGKYRLYVISSVVIVGSLLLYVTEWPECWYASALAFLFGVLCGEKYSLMVAFLQKWSGRLLLILLIVTGLISVIWTEANFFTMYICRNSICLGGIGLLFVFVQYIRLDNVFLRFLTKLSTELYLIQFVYWKIAESLNFSWVPRMIMVLICTVVTSVLLHPLTIKVQRTTMRLFQTKS